MSIINKMLNHRLQIPDGIGGLVLVAALAVWPSAADAQVVVAATDGKMHLVDGVNTPMTRPLPDTVTILTLDGARPRVLAELRVPNSIIGPPQSVAITPDGALALVTASTKIDPADGTKTLPDDQVTVIDLKAATPTIIATLHAGAGANGVSINRAGTLALVANRNDGSVSVFTISGKTVTPAGKVDLGAPGSFPSHVVFTRDGRMALVTRNMDSLVSLLAIDGTKVTYTKTDIGTGLRPYGIDVTPAGDAAVVANIGAGQMGGVDTLSVIDLTATPVQVVSHLTIGHIPEGVAISPDGQFVAVTVINGTNSAPTSPVFHDFGILKIVRLANKTLTPVTERRMGRWCQGAVWSRDGKTLLVQCAVEQELQVFRFDGRTLTADGAIKVNGTPAGMRAGQ